MDIILLQSFLQKNVEQSETWVSPKRQFGKETLTNRSIYEWNKSFKDGYESVDREWIALLQSEKIDNRRNGW